MNKYELLLVSEVTILSMRAIPGQCFIADPPSLVASWRFQLHPRRTRRECERLLEDSSDESEESDEAWEKSLKMLAVPMGGQAGTGA